MEPSCLTWYQTSGWNFVSDTVLSISGNMHDYFVSTNIQIMWTLRGIQLFIALYMRWMCFQDKNCSIQFIQNTRYNIFYCEPFFMRYYVSSLRLYIGKGYFVIKYFIYIRLPYWFLSEMNDVKSKSNSLGFPLLWDLQSFDFQIEPTDKAWALYAFVSGEKNSPFTYAKNFSYYSPYNRRAWDS